MTNLPTVSGTICPFRLLVRRIGGRGWRNPFRIVTNEHYNLTNFTSHSEKGIPRRYASYITRLRSLGMTDCVVPTTRAIYGRR